MFQGCKTLSNISHLKTLCTKGITNFSNMFSYCWRLKSIKALKDWDVSDGTDFQECL